MKKLLLFIILSGSVFAASPFRTDYIETSPYHSTIGYGGARRNNLHQGSDLWCKDPIIFSILPGVVKEIGIDSIYGKYVIIEHEDGLFSLYAHGSIIYYSALPGSIVDNSVPIMRMGSTGYSDGPHLHIETYRIIDGVKVNEDPEKYISSVEVKNKDLGETNERIIYRSR